MIIFDTHADGYSPAQCGHTMTVRELIEVLEDLDADEKVYFGNDQRSKDWDDGGIYWYTYGAIRGSRIYTDFEEEEDED